MTVCGQNISMFKVELEFGPVASPTAVSRQKRSCMFSPTKSYNGSWSFISDSWILGSANLHDFPDVNK